VQLLDLLLIELTNWRWSWRTTIVVDTIAPLLSMLALGVFARDRGAATLAYVLTGNVVVALMFGTMGKVHSHVGYLRYSGALAYFATLPIRRWALVVAIVAAFLLLALPSLLVTIFGGAWLLGVALSLHPLVLVVVPLCALPLAGIGALIAVSVREPGEGNALTLLLTLLLAGTGPVVIPPDRLPPFMLTLGWLSPATYAASALRQTLLGPVTPRLALDLAVLALIAAVLLAVVSRRLEWRA
jgi:ABC-2 type transport system permease protein